MQFLQLRVQCSTSELSRYHIFFKGTVKIKETFYVSVVGFTETFAHHMIGLPFCFMDLFLPDLGLIIFGCGRFAAFVLEAAADAAGLARLPDRAKRNRSK